MSKPTFENLELDTANRIAILKVNRPNALNALNEATLRELKSAFAYIETCAPGSNGPEVIAAVIFTGAGDKAFIAGADIKEMKDRDSLSGEEFARLGQNVTYSMEQIPQPIIAAVNGFALGGGCEFAMACDFILASENAVFGQPEVLLGVIPGFGGCYRLPKYVGLAMARELIFSGRKVKAAEAKEIGLAVEVVPQTELLTRATVIATSIMKNSPLAVARSKQAINQIHHLAADAGLRAEASFFGGLFGSHDQREGMSAFVEKRAAEFTGN